MDNITIVFCEGQHDIAFLSKILYVHGYKEYKNKLKDFKEPLGEQYLSILREEKNIEEKKLGFNPIYKIPSVALYKEDNNELVLFHNMGGDERKTEREELLLMYKNLQTADDDFSSFNLNFKFLYFFDADINSVEYRIDELNQELNLSEKIEHNIILKTDDSYLWSCYVFHNNAIGGNLEDVLLDLMRPSNEEIFKNTEAFVASNRLTPNEREKEYKPFDDSYESQCKFKEKKSIIAIAGQLQFSGMANAVIISKSDFIKKADILDSDICNNIIKMFS
jgi:hypothetical protein